MSPLGTRAGPGRARGRRSWAQSVCDGDGRLRDGADPHLRAVHVRRQRGRLPRQVHRQRASATRDTPATRRGSCGKRPHRRVLQGQRRLHLGLLRRRRLLQLACQGPASPATSPGALGTCSPIDLGTPDPRGVCTDQGTASCGHNGTLRRRRRLRDLRAGDRLPRAVLLRQPAQHGGDLRRARHLPPARVAGLLRRSAASRRRPARRSARPTRLRRRESPASKGSCGPKPNGQPCAQAERVQVGPVRRRRLLRERLHRRLPELRAADLARHLHDGRGRQRRSARHLPGHRAPPLRDQRQVRRRRELPDLRRRGPAAPPRPAPRTSTPARRPATRRPVRRARRPRPAPLRLQRQRVLQRLHDRQRSAWRPTPARATRAASSNGAVCSAGNQCQSGFCAQGVCCNTACAGACQSCALAGTLGTCTNVATGTTDPAGICKDQGTTTCGTNGKCQAGACQKYVSGTTCTAASCPSGVGDLHRDLDLRRRRHLRHAGRRARASPTSAARTPARTPARPTATATSPAVCTNGSCGLKDTGGACASGTECKSGFCSQGVCCATTCNGTCKSCALVGHGRDLHQRRGRRQRSAGRPATTKGSPPAAPTASATATAPASGTPPAPSASPPAALRDRRR